MLSLVVLLVACSKQPPVQVVEATTAREFHHPLDAINAAFGAKNRWVIQPLKNDTEIYVTLIVQVPIEEVGRKIDEYQMRIAGQEFKPVAMKLYHFDGPDRAIARQIILHKQDAFGPPGPYLLPPRFKPGEPAILSFAYIVPKALLPAPYPEFFFGGHKVRFTFQ